MTAVSSFPSYAIPSPQMIHQPILIPASAGLHLQPIRPYYQLNLPLPAPQIDKFQMAARAAYAAHHAGQAVLVTAVVPGLFPGRQVVVGLKNLAQVGRHSKFVGIQLNSSQRFLTLLGIGLGRRFGLRGKF